MQPVRPTTGSTCPCGAERTHGKPLCQPHMNKADPQLVARWFNRKKRVVKNPSDNEAVRLLTETTMQLAEGVRQN